MKDIADKEDFLVTQQSLLGRFLYELDSEITNHRQFYENTPNKGNRSRLLAVIALKAKLTGMEREINEKLQYLNIVRDLPEATLLPGFNTSPIIPTVSGIPASPIPLSIGAPRLPTVSSPRGFPVPSSPRTQSILPVPNVPSPSQGVFSTSSVSLPRVASPPRISSPSRPLIVFPTETSSTILPPSITSPTINPLATISVPKIPSPPLYPS